MAQNITTDEEPACPCNGLSFDAQLARMIAMAYDPKGPEADIPQAKDIHDCYSFEDLPYELRKDGIMKKLLGLVKWSTPRAVVGRCAKKSDVCAVSFSGAADISMVAGIVDYGPAFLSRDEDGKIIKTYDRDGVHAFHSFYWDVYDQMRSQVGEKLLQTLDGCSKIVVTGHSIGAAMSSVFQWEHDKLPIEQITIGQNPAWFGTPPDVGCRGKRIVSEIDPVPYLRPFVYRGDVIRHPLLPMQALKKKSGGGWTVEELTSCDSNEPIDQKCARYGCSPYSWHYNKRIYKGINDHQAVAYVAALDAANEGSAAV